MSFILARLVGAHTAPVAELPVAAGVTAMKRGALMVKDATGAWAECGADPTSVGGIAESDYGADTTGFAAIGRNEFPPGYMQGTKVAGEVQFHAEYVGTLPAAEGASYGVVKGADGLWRVDFAETVALVVKLVGLQWTASPLNRPRVLVVFLPAVVQIV